MYLKEIKEGDSYASCDGHVVVFRDKDGDGTADGPPETLFKLLFGEHGAHAIAPYTDAPPDLCGNMPEISAKTAL